MITYKNETIQLSTIAHLRATKFSLEGDYALDSLEYKANVDYIEQNPEYGTKWMFENTKPSEFGLSFDKWESLEGFEIK